MPNHCENELYVYGSPKGIKEFIEFARATVHEQDETISCDKFIPYPQRFKDLDEIASRAVQEMSKLPKAEWDYMKIPKDGFNSGGYQWCVDNWGTKWGMYDFSEWKIDECSAFISFLTAWSPPQLVVRAMAEQFPKLRFVLKYYEKGRAFQGVFEVKGSEVLRDECSEYRGHRGG